MKMKWSKSSSALIEKFSKLVPSDPRVERRQMFGYPCAFVGDNMFMGLHQEHLILRLSEEERARFLALKGSSVFEPMPGRPMREYVVVPEALLSEPSQLREWSSRALNYAASLPSKKSSPRKTSAKKTKRPVP